jgi:hypothetical protein
LSIQGFGELSFPLSAQQVEGAIQFARKAPYGKGSKTIIDPNVRDAWEIDAAQITFDNPKWLKLIETIVGEVKVGLGIETHEVRASLYKLLVYEKGHFFLPHKDSEKEKGMFGTLVVGLPSEHTGGALHVRFDGREEIADFSLADRFSIPYTAFYADCEHEIKPITAGYRVALVYNLVQESKTNGSVRAPHFGEQVAQMSKLLKEEVDAFDEVPIAILLDHQYTPTNFSSSSLKLHDRPRAEALMLAAENAGYFAVLGLVSHHLHGEMIPPDRPYRGRRSRGYYEDDDYGNDDFENAKMGEVYEQDTSVQHWATDGVPGLGEIDFDLEGIIGGAVIGNDDPFEKDAEGFTGNAGMTLEYWYHYGAVILWPQQYYEDVLASRPIKVQLKWVQFLLQNWTSTAFAAPDLTIINLEILSEEIIAKEQLDADDFSPLLRAMVRFPQSQALLTGIKPSLPRLFELVEIQDWIDFAEAMGSEELGNVLDAAAARGKIVVTQKITEVIAALLQHNAPELKQLGQTQRQKLPDHLAILDLPNETPEGIYQWRSAAKGSTEDCKKMLSTVLDLCLDIEDNNKWVDYTFAAIVHTMPRKYIHEILGPILLKSDTPQSVLSLALVYDCIEHLKEWTANEPAPPQNWTRELPQSISQKSPLALLKNFMESPVLHIFDYIQREALRKEMEYAIKDNNLDLHTVTIAKGSPHNLRITKTQASYERKLKIWSEDMALLGRLETRGSVWADTN